MTIKYLKNDGFTLLELIIVLFIISALTLVSLFSMGFKDKQAALKMAASEIINYMQKARMDAITTNCEKFIIFHVINNTLTYNSVNIAIMDQKKQINYGIGNATESPHRGSLRPVSYAGGKLIFTPLGGVKSPGTVYIQAPNGNCIAIWTQISGNHAQMSWDGQNWRE